MGFNKKVLSKAVSELDKAKAPAKPRDITVDPMGYWNPANQGQPVRVPGNDITMHNVKAPVWAQPNVGPGVLMEPEKNYNFKDASYVDETPMAKKGGTAGKLSNDNGLVTKVVPMKFDLPELKGAEKINDKVTLAMSPDSTGLYKIGKDIEKFCGIPEADVIRDVKAGKDKPEDAIIYGMSNIMNGGKDIYLWINGTRLQGVAKEKGIDAAIMEIVSHESLHITRKLLTRAIAKSKGVSVDNEDWVKHDYGDGEYMWPAIGDVSEKHPIVQIDEEAFATAEGYVTERILPHFLEMAKKYLDINKDKVFKKGGTLQSKKYSSSISATNKLFTKNKLFQNKKSKIFDPNAKFKSGGQSDGVYTHSGHKYKKIDGKWYIEPVKNSGEYKLIEQGNVKTRIAELEKNAKNDLGLPDNYPTVKTTPKKQEIGFKKQASNLLENLVYHPFTSAELLMNKQGIPTDETLDNQFKNKTYGYYKNGAFKNERSGFDNHVTDNFAIGFAHSADKVIDRATNDIDGDFFSKENAWDAAQTIPGFKYLRPGMKAVNSGLKILNPLKTTTKGVLLNTAEKVFKKGGSKLGPINLNPNPLSHYELNYGFNLPTKQDGGENEDEYMDLTDEEIQAYKEAGYEVDEEPEYEIGGYVQHELVKAQKGKTVKTFKRDVRDQDAQSNTGWSSAPVQQKKVSTNKKTPTTLKEKLNQTPQQAFDNDFKVVTAKENAVLKEKNKEQINTFKNQQMPGYKDYGPQSAGSADWFWTLPIAGPAALEAAGSIGAMSLPGMSSVSGATVGNLANAAAIGHGITQTPETIKAWNDVSEGKKKWQDAALETGINLSEFIGAGSGVKSLAQDVNQGAKYLNKGIKTASNYGKDLAYSSKQAGKLKFPTYQPVSRWDPEHVPYSLQQAGRDLTPEQQALTGSWYSYKPKGVNDYEHTIGFYPTNRPGPGTLKHLRLSEREIANLENSMSDAAKGMSGKSESVTTSSDYLKGELNLPQYLRNKTKSVKFDVNPSEYIPQSHGAEPRSSFGMGQTGQHIADVLRSQYPKLAGIPRQYLPFKDGGAIHEIWEDELDEHTIALLRRAGYTVEELD